MVNIPYLVVRYWTPQKYLDLYNITKNVFMFSNIKEITMIRYDTIFWKTYYNMICKRKGRLQEKKGDN